MVGKCAKIVFFGLFLMFYRGENTLFFVVTPYLYIACTRLFIGVLEVFCGGKGFKMRVCGLRGGWCMAVWRLHVTVWDSLDGYGSLLLQIISDSCTMRLLCFSLLSLYFMVRVLICSFRRPISSVFSRSASNSCL